MRRQTIGNLAVGLLLAFVLAGSTASWAQGPYHVQTKWKIGGDGGWDYLAVDPQSELLYITRGNHVMVVNPSSGQQVADITGLHGTHGVAFDPDSNEGYISDGAANAVAVFNRKTNTITQTIPAGTNPDGILYEPYTHTVWAFNGRSKNATVIDTKTKKVVATVPLPGKPEFPVADGKGSVFVNIEDKNEMAHLDAKTHALLAEWPTCDSPSGNAIDIAHDRLFSVCDGKKMAVVDALSGKVVATPEIGDGPDAAAFDPRTGNAFSSNGEGTLTVVHQNSPDSYTVLENVNTQRSARTMALDTKTGKIYLVAAEFGPRPAATPENPRPRPPVLPGSFTIIVVSR
ncbi:YncE family protein [Pseudacidobacterium ailaaui]|jgi:YVTN family beta-propeller protein|uniref:YncE family protein n=1 Tax=Pseudacidobacterium ailaaui TaxID=1382359 RepID=UPI0005D2495D|nr:YncE family protein [Pseudacidobacterium ailaaui]MBX6360811.1 YncE family protein [Pseudacidobacterium ailaaui]MCL6464512.1 YncE family protein [Pseudacidobacterium ailaaui]MDI3254458.1 YncE family protein [Bacillota bacterium]